jgi:hypothetical protein
MIVETKPLEQRDFSPVGSQGSFDNRFVSTFGENNPTVFTERREGGGAGEELDHMWKATEGVDPDFEGEGEPDEGYLVTGGSLVVQGEAVEIEGVFIAKAANQKFIVLTVTRDPASRVLSEVGGEEPVIEAIEEGELEATAGRERYVLAEIITPPVGDPPEDPPLEPFLRQHRFEEIISHELMIVENGEFKLGPFVMLTRNTYEPPAP